jgi:hypothetical protein
VRQLRYQLWVTSPWVFRHGVWPTETEARAAARSLVRPGHSAELGVFQAGDTRFGRVIRL